MIKFNAQKIAKYCDLVCFAGLLLTAFYIPVAITPTNIGICLSIVAFLVKKIVTRDPHLIEGDLTFLIPLFFIFAFITTSNAIDMKAVKTGSLKMLKYLAIFAVVSSGIRTPKRLKMIIWAFVFGALLVSVDGIVQFFAGKDFIRFFPAEYGNPLDGIGGQFKRMKASFHNSQDFASYLAVAVPLLLGLFRYGSYQKKQKILLGITLAVSLYCLVFTYSRGAALALLFAVIFFTIAMKDKIILPVILILGVAAPFVLAKSPLTWVTSRHSFIELFTDSSRLQHWQAAVNMIKAHPFMGIGLNNFCANYDKFKSSGDFFSGWYAHQTYLQMAAEIGLIGLGIFLAIIIVSIIRWVKILPLIKDREIKTISFALFAGMMGFLIAGLLDSNLQYSNLAVLFWLVFSLFYRIKNIQEN